MYKLFLTVRYLRKRRIAYFAIAAVTLCVAMVLIVMSIMGGWLDQMKKRARGLLGDVIMDNHSAVGFPLYDEFIARISAWPEIEKATPVIYTQGLMRITGRTTEHTNLVGVVGLRLQDVFVVNAFRSSLFYERYYPGTTSLGPIRQPMIGFDHQAPPLKRDGDLVLRQLALPEPYQSALERARAEHQAATGRSLVADDEVETDLNAFLREHGQPPIPGRFELSVETDDGGPVLAGDPLPGLIIGRDLVAQRKSDGAYDRIYPLGTKTTLTLWAMSVRGGVDPVPVKQVFRYADDSRTGVYEIDSRHVYADFDLLQPLLRMDPLERVDDSGKVVGRSPPRCSQIQIKLRAGVDASGMTERLTRAYRELADDTAFELDLNEQRLVRQVEAQTWEQSQAHIIGPVERERKLVTTLFGIISLVAVALVLCILYMIVLQKTRDIGIIKALGGSSTGVALIFVCYGAAVGIVGSVLGSALGITFVTYINEFQEFLISIDPAMRVWDLQVYSFDRIPSTVDPADVVRVVGFAIVASTLGSFAAAWRAGTMEPVEAIRDE